MHQCKHCTSPQWGQRELKLNQDCQSGPEPYRLAQKRGLVSHCSLQRGSYLIMYVLCVSRALLQLQKYKMRGRLTDNDLTSVRSSYQQCEVKEQAEADGQGIGSPVGALAPCTHCFLSVEALAPCWVIMACTAQKQADKDRPCQGTQRRDQTQVPI